MADDAGEAKPKCFIAMPITTSDAHAEMYGDQDHWTHVIEALHIPAVEAAGFEPVRPEAQGSILIHDNIIRNLEQCEMVLVDLSADNPNVFFELGIRTAINRPIALVWDELTRLPFDTSGINTMRYSAGLEAWTLDEQRKLIAQHLREASASCDGKNPLWDRYGLRVAADRAVTNKSPLEAKVELLAKQVESLTYSQSSSRDDIEIYPGQRINPVSGRVESQDADDLPKGVRSFVSLLRSQMRKHDLTGTVSVLGGTVHLAVKARDWTDEKSSPVVEEFIQDAVYMAHKRDIQIIVRRLR